MNPRCFVQWLYELFLVNYMKQFSFSLLLKVLTSSACWLLSESKFQTRCDSVESFHQWVDENQYNICHWWWFLISGSWIDHMTEFFNWTLPLTVYVMSLRNDVHMNFSGEHVIPQTKMCESLVFGLTVPVRQAQKNFTCFGFWHFTTWSSFGYNAF